MATKRKQILINIYDDDERILDIIKKTFTTDKSTIVRAAIRLLWIELTSSPRFYAMIEKTMEKMDKREEMANQ